MAIHYSLAAIITILLGTFTLLNAYTVRPIMTSPKSYLGEGPHWDQRTMNLYYVSIGGNDSTILRYCYSDGKVYGARIIGNPIVTFIIPVKGTKDQFAVGLIHTCAVIQWDGKSQWARVIRTVLEVETCPEYTNNRFNDAKADPYGRLFAGTKREEGCTDLVTPTRGNLFRIHKDHPTVTILKPGSVFISNGLAWDKKHFYYIDSCTFNIKKYDWNPSTGQISCERVLYNFTAGGAYPGYDPDGLTIDKDGKLYAGTYGGSKVVVVDSKTGRWIMDIPFPCKQVTSCAWGGPNLDILYVTTSAAPNTGEQTEWAGYLFEVRDLDTHGRAGVECCV